MKTVTLLAVQGQQDTDDLVLAALALDFATDHFTDFREYLSALPEDVPLSVPRADVDQQRVHDAHRTIAGAAQATAP